MFNKVLFCYLLFFSLMSNAQFAVYDAPNHATNIQNTVHQIKNFLQNIKDYQELIKQSAMQVRAFKEGGLFDETFKSLKDIATIIRDSRDIINNIKALDEYDVIQYLAVNQNWYRDIQEVLFYTHNLLRSEDLTVILSFIEDVSPELGGEMTKWREDYFRNQKNVLNSMYYVSSRKDFKSKRKNILDKQKRVISGLQDLSLGESANLSNAQLLLMSQQLEELIGSIEHLILTKDSERFDELKQRQDFLELIKAQSISKRNFDINEFLGN